VLVAAGAEHLRRGAHERRAFGERAPAPFAEGGARVGQGAIDGIRGHGLEALEDLSGRGVQGLDGHRRLSFRLDRRPPATGAAGGVVRRRRSPHARVFDDHAGRMAVQSEARCCA
jgi:hypothetical protein